MEYGLPTQIEIAGRSWNIRTDYRVILTIFEALNDLELSDTERTQAALTLFYVDFEDMAWTDYREAVDQMLWFINCGSAEDERKSKAQLVSWEQDYNLIIPAVNRVLGQEVRGVAYDYDSNAGGLHWWTFMGAYAEIGDCLFAQVVGIRSKKAKGKRLEPHENEFYRNNRSMVDIKMKYTQQDDDVLKAWTGGG